ncbi:MAG: hypothetical protein IT216_05350 [Saprospiraceae bacterium]|nr:hypothetical protein [Saprospiraceae bacterium]WKZ62697.1 MAG: hypothetical protein QY315_13110 [Saprospiraceae bacterium]
MTKLFVLISKQRHTFRRQRFFLSAIWLLAAYLCFSQESDSMRIYTQVDHMPQLVSCASGYGNMYKLDRCTVASLKAWMLANMQYPATALESGREERYSFRALVDTTGQIKEIKPAQDLSSECGNEADRLTKLMLHSGEKWTSGRQGTRKVPVWIEFCIEFNAKDWQNELTRRANPQAFVSRDSLALKPVKPEMPKAKSKVKPKSNSKAGNKAKKNSSSKSKYSKKKTSTKKKR